MTANRNIPKDQIATSALLNRFAYDPDAVKDEEGPNWLGHGAKTDKRAGAQIDAALVLGATEKELCEIRPTWREHLFHLSKEHGLTVVRQADIYRFQDPEQTEEADALLSAEQAQEPFVEVRAQIDVKPDPQRIAQAVTPSRVCAFVVLPSRTEEQAEVVLTYSIREGTDHLKVFANRTVFIVTGMLKDAVQAAANAVASVWNMWVDDRPDHPQRPRPIPGHYVRPREDWANERLPMNGGNYVYEYRGSKSETF